MSHTVDQSPNRLSTLLVKYRPESLRDFLLRTATGVEDLYRRDGVLDEDTPVDLQPDCWTTWRRRTGLNHDDSAADRRTEAFLFRRLRRFLHVDDQDRADSYCAVATGQAAYRDMDPRQQTFARMLVTVIYYPFPGEYDAIAFPETIDGALAQIRSCPAFARELAQLFAFTLRRGHRVKKPVSGGFANGVLRLHAQYRIQELIAAVSKQLIGLETTRPEEEGTYDFMASRLTLLAATLSDKGVTAGGDRHTVALSPKKIAWTAPSGFTLDSPRGQMYLHHDDNRHTIFLAVRKKSAHSGIPAEFTLLGPAHYSTHRGEDAVEFVALLEDAMPTELCQQWLACGC
ncbi:DUF3427 domain-containing protein [Corynebacterium mendelii]|uniref:DUF3427 domain-containing protein n=1 Tax=Corynebacterium mendelii TaxID=2765362 RepID=A0A939DXQ3_9CORY|nr:DUF3427 domain-containing protein [Corynebacterium mendelii]MBN9643150.1 DUF3427 domain-containing protein [Corynebacterium mendelii]